MAGAAQGSSQSERWLGRGIAALACAVVALLFWSLSAGMQQSSCRTAIAGNPDCVNPGPSARILLAWAVLGAMSFAAAIVGRRILRRRRLVREGMNFVRSESLRVLRGERLVGWSAASCWAAAASAGLGLALSGAGAVLAIVAAVFALVALGCWLVSLRLRHY